jgi:site-specific recombinase XerC
MPTVEQILHVLATMPVETDIEKRDRAVIAFTLLTGARDGATASFKLKHIDMVAGKVDHAREVATKRAKTFPTYFFPVGDDIRAIVAEWVDFLRHKKLWGDDDPLFPKRDSLAFTKVNRSMAIHSNPGIHCNKERQMCARKNPRADLSDP